MPRDKTIKKVLLIGSGPIVIGQGCEFDYSGTQALKAFKDEGIETVLVNPNPATIMTDKRFSKAVYIEPLTLKFLEKIIAREKPDALLPTMGGQTALNLALELSDKGILKKYRVKLIGAQKEAIFKAEDRKQFRQVIEKIGLKVPHSMYVTKMSEAEEAVTITGLPAILRPSFTLGGKGASIAYNLEEYQTYLKAGLQLSPVGSVLVEQSVIGWKEYELEVMRDKADNVVIVCSIENLDPMGIHTGDSITVAPAQTLSDVDYQTMRQAAIKIIREIGVDTGGSNIQFAVNPEDGQLVVIEMNPRVSRSSALASKATGFPIAKIAALLSLGYTLDELNNDITKVTPASFEPAIDYVVTKIPRFDFLKFRQATDSLTTSMKSVGEVMAIGRTFRESLQKALRSLETGVDGFSQKGLPAEIRALYKRKGESAAKRRLEMLIQAVSTPSSLRLFAVAEAFRFGLEMEDIQRYSLIDPWFLEQIRLIIKFEEDLKAGLVNVYGMPEQLLRAAKQNGFADSRIASLFGIEEKQVRQLRMKKKIIPAYKTVDTCSAEFAAKTPYLYSSYDLPEVEPLMAEKKIIILGSGPNRIGQGIEFDACCVQASFSLQKLGYQTIMVNCNPETVSTDFDISDRLYFEPLTFEEVMNIIEHEKPYGVIVQLGGQTPLKLASQLSEAGVNILGTSQEMIDRAEDRERFKRLLDQLDLRQAKSGTAVEYQQALNLANSIGYPLLVRPSYVLGGRAMEIVYDEEHLKDYFERAVAVSPEKPILIDSYLENATEIDVDAVSDGKNVYLAGIMEHIEEAGIHSGDSCCVLPPQNLSGDILYQIKKATTKIARALEIKGLLNIQFAVFEDDLYIIEVNPRTSRTVPFVSKATGTAVIDIAVRAMVGEEIKGVIPPAETESLEHVAVKAPVFPFLRFEKVDPLLGPEMKSTGEVMGIDKSFPLAFYKAQIASFNALPEQGTVFISVNERDKAEIIAVAKRMSKSGFKIIATRGTAKLLKSAGIKVEQVKKVREGRPNIVDKIKSGEVQLVMNTTSGRSTRSDSYSIRRTTLERGIPYFTTLRGSRAAAKAIAMTKKKDCGIYSLQEYSKENYQ